MINGDLKRKDDQLKRMRSGGNQKFISFLKEFDLHDASIYTKYKTKAVDYYRKKLDAEMTGEILGD